MNKPRPPRGSGDKGIRESSVPTDVKQRVRRYTLALDVTYTIRSGRGTVTTGRGRTIDLSSSELRFVSEAPLKTARTITVAIMWPLLLDDAVKLQLVVSGKVLRTSEVETVVQIKSHEFRTRVSSAKPVSRLPDRRTSK